MPPKKNQPQQQRAEKAPSRRTTPARKATLRDVAEYCGVSTMTVSRVLNNKGVISPRVSARIRKAVAKLDYTPNLVAKSLRDSRTRSIGMVITDSSDLLFSHMTRGVIDAAGEADHSVIIANTQQREDLQIKSISMMLNKRIDGLVLGAPYPIPSEQVRELQTFGIPVVVLMRTNNQGFDFINSDNVAGGYEIVRHVLDLGYRNIRFLNLYRLNPNGEERRVGNRRAMEERGLVYDESLDVFSYPSIEDGRAAMHAILKGGDKPDAVVCGGDVLAIGAIEACLEAGLAVPGDIGICGFDDSRMLDYLKVPLTTMRQDVGAMAREGVRILLERRENSDADQIRMLLPCEFVRRESL